MNRRKPLCSGSFTRGGRLNIPFVEFMLEDHDA